MSKTYRKATFTDYQKGGTKRAKRSANKKIRQFEGELPEGSSFTKKITDACSIHDFRSTMHGKRDLEECLDNEAVCKRDPDLYKEKNFKRESIRHLEV